MIKVFLLAQTQIDFKSLFVLTKDACGRSITRELDSRNLKCDNLPGYLCALGELLQPGGNPLNILREPGSLLNHIHLSFLVVLDHDTLHTIILETDLKVLECDSTYPSFQVAIISGILTQWRTAIINGCTPITFLQLRGFYNQILATLDNIGLGKPFENYSRKDNKDTTYTLIEK